MRTLLVRVALLCGVFNLSTNLSLGQSDPAFDPGNAPNGAILDAAAQADGKLIFVGEFTEFSSQPAGHVVRLHADGSLDSSFTIGAGANNTVHAIDVQADGRIVVAGEFHSFDGHSAGGILRLNTDGSVDASFELPSPPDGPVLDVAVQADGRILIAGDFNTLGGLAAGGVARLNADGSVDMTFSSGNGFDGPVTAVALQTDGQIVVAGDFSTADQVGANGLARLNAEGSVDAEFTAANEFDGPVLDAAVQADGRIVVAGEFSSVNGTASKATARLHADGSLDASFQPLLGEEAALHSVAVQVDGRILLAGSFETVNGDSISAVARLHADGSLDAAFNTNGGLQGDGLALLVQADGKVVVSGTLQLDGSAEALVRLLPEDDSMLPDVPEITRDPLDQALQAGMNATLRVAAKSSTGVSYQWQKNSLALAGETDATLELENVTTADAGDYSVLITNAAGVSTSAAASVTVEVPDEPVIVIPPVDQTVTAGADIEFTVRASGTAPLAFTWEKDGATLSSQTEASLELQSVTTAEAGTYTVTVSNLTGASASASATLTVEPAQPPQIVVEPIDQTVPPGAPVMFTVAVSGTAPFDFQWNHDGQAIEGETSASLLIASAATLDAGDYSVTVSNSAGATTSTTASLTVGVPLPPVVVTPPISQSVTAGADVGFAVTASGSAPLFFQWMKDGVTLEGETSASLSLTAVTEADAGDYSVRVTNSAGSDTSAAATLTVLEPQPPVVVVPPLDQTVAVGATVSFTVTASGQTPMSFQWMKDGALLEGEVESTLTLSSIVEADAGNYSVRISNEIDTTVSESATLTVVNPNLSGSLDLTFNLSGRVTTSGAINDITLAGDGSILVGGDFGTINGEAANRLARLSADGTVESSFQIGAGPDAPVRSVEAQADGHILVGGEFTMFGDENQPYLVRLGAGGTVDTAFTTQPNGPVNDIAITAGGQILVSGEFTTVNGEAADGIARLHADGSLDTSFQADASIEGNPHEILVQSNGQILVAGDITASTDGDVENELVRLNASGAIDAAFASNFDLNPGSSVLAIHLDGNGRILIGGDFTAVNGTPAPGLARLNADGSLDTTFQAALDNGSEVAAVAVQADGRVLVAGDLDLDGGSHTLVRLESDGTVDAEFDAQTGEAGAILALTLQADGQILVGGTDSLLRLEGDLSTAVAVVLDGHLENTSFTVEFQSENEVVYTLEQTPSLDNPSWNVRAEAAGNGSVMVLTDEAAISGNGFYRVRIAAD